MTQFFYNVLVEYQEMLATANQIMVTEKQGHDKLVLMLGGKTVTSHSDNIKVQAPPLTQVQRYLSHSPSDTTSASIEEKATLSGRVVDTEGNTEKSRVLSISLIYSVGEFSFKDIESGPLKCSFSQKSYRLTR